MIDVTNLSKYFGFVMAVDRINFHVDRGEIVGLLGLNGAGKTTTMRMLTTFLPATSGSARLAGFDVRTQSMEVRKQIGYLPENVPLYPEMRVEEYLDYRAKLKHLPRKERQARIDYCLSRCRIKEVRRRLVGTLSKGYRQRVGLADAMVADPAILILDEPTSGLDPVQIRETLLLIKELGESRTILLSTHILSEIEEVCGRIMIIHRGRLASDRKIKELERNEIVVLEVTGPKDRVHEVLKTTEGVDTVRSETGEGEVVHCEVALRGQGDMREMLAQRITRNGWVIRQLEQRRKRVDEHFMDIVTGT